MDFFVELVKNFANDFSWKQLVMYAVGVILIYLAIRKKMEPALLLPMGFGAIIVNLPNSGVLTQVIAENDVNGIIQWMFEIGIEAAEALPLLLFIGIGAMIDFGPLLSNPKLMFFGAAAQVGIFITIILATLIGNVDFIAFGKHITFDFNIKEAVSIGIIGAADGPTSILVANSLGSKYMGAIAVAAYSYMALVPIIQPMAIKLATTKEERKIRMDYNPKDVSQTAKIIFPIVVTMVAGLVAPASVALVGFLMFGNLLKECGVLDNLTETASKSLVNLITLVLGLIIAFSMKAEAFVTLETVVIMLLGLFAFVFDTIGGVMFVKLINLFAKKKINPMIGAAGISAFPMSARVVQKLGLEADPENHLLMHAISANVSGQIASVLAGGFILTMFMI